MKKAFSSTAALIALILATASQVGAELPVAGRRALVGSRYSDHGSPALLTSGLSGDPVAPAWRQPRDRAENLGLRRPAPGRAADAAGECGHSPCRQGDRGRLIRNERVASYPTPASVRAYFDEWLAFYQDFYQFPPDLPVAFDYGFDSYKVTYCTVDTLLPGQAAARPTTATGMVSVPRKPEPLPTVVYLHGTSVSFYDAVSNPNIFCEFEERGESFDGPPSSSVFAGAGFIYIAPDYLGLGDS